MAGEARTTDCPCGSGRALGTCCGPLLDGEPAATAEQLMRSRYTAYALGFGDYVLRTWHGSTRPAALDTALPVWQGLEIVAAEAGGVGDEAGTVEFRARYLDRGRPGVLHETSRFAREHGRWVYVDGRLHPAVSKAAPGRNRPCPCGSGRKYKRCCGR